MIKFETMEDGTGVTKVKSLVFSQAKVGKTMLSCTMPEPVLLINAEKGLLSLSEKNQMKVFGRVANIVPARVDTLRDMEELAEKLEKDKQYRDFKSVVLDSITELADLSLCSSMKVNKDGRKAHGDMQIEVAGIFRRFRDLLHHHVLFIAQQEQAIDEILKKRLYMASMPGSKMAGRINYFFDEVFHLGIGSDGNETWRYLRCHPDNQYFAGDRSGSLDEIEPADMTHIINKIIAHE